MALLVNRNSSASMAVANAYARLRQVPDENIIYLDLPAALFAPPYQASLIDFGRCIRGPVQQELARRGIQDHVFAWIYSVDFPVRIDTGEPPPLSIQGATFLMNATLPGTGVVARGDYVSPLYAGPTPNVPQLKQSRTLDDVARELGSAMPVPSMMLGFTGRNGNDLATVLESLRRGVMADGAGYRGTVYLLRNDDIRSTCRDWQYRDVQRTLMASGINVVITSNTTIKAGDILGLMMGAEQVDPAAMGSFLPGCMAEHLTSLAAVFDVDNQTKLTAWIKAGATASCGTVVEPYARWTKFPAAYFYVHYLRGCSMLESFFQSICCPLQILLVGEPLACPWRKLFSLTTVTLDDDPLTGASTFYTEVMPQVPARLLRFEYFLDGRRVAGAANSPELELDTTRLADGYHRLRVVASGGRPVAMPAFSVKGFTVDNHGRAVSLAGAPDRSEVDYHATLPLQAAATGGAREVGLVHRERVLRTVAATNTAALPLAAALLGQGPGTVQAFARYADGMEVRSTPLSLNVTNVVAQP